MCVLSLTAAQLKCQPVRNTTFYLKLNLPLSELQAETYICTLWTDTSKKWPVPFVPHGQPQQTSPFGSVVLNHFWVLNCFTRSPFASPPFLIWHAAPIFAVPCRLPCGFLFKRIICLWAWQSLKCCCIAIWIWSTIHRHCQVVRAYVKVMVMVMWRAWHM